jgi:CheY-like chemotaxis protein
LGHTAIPTTDKNEFETVGAYCYTPNDNTPNNNTPNNNTPDVVFTDLEMGDLNGYEVLQKIKSRFNLPVICLSGSAATSKAELRHIGFDDFLEKPFSLHQLEKILVPIHKRKTAPTSGLFSLNTLNEMFNNDNETVYALLDTFAKSLPDDIQSFECALVEENLVLVQQTAHKILPFCKQIHANEVVPILEKIEISKKENHIQFSDLKKDVVLLIANLKALLSQILLLNTKA